MYVYFMKTRGRKKNTKTKSRKRRGGSNIKIEKKIKEVFPSIEHISFFMGKYMINDTGYRKEKQLGKGAFGTVYLLQKVFDEKMFAIKELNLTERFHAKKSKYKDNTDEELITRILDEIKSEINILNFFKKYCHTYYLCYENIYYSYVGGNIYIIILMEYLEGNSLFDLITGKAYDTDGKIVKITEKDKIDIIDQICQGVLNLHHMAVAHRDLKPENIYVYKKDGKYHIKLLDFGLSDFLDPKREYYQSGTPIYSYPEILVNEKVDEMTVKISDLWSIAMIVIFMFDINLFVKDIKPKLYDLIGNFKGNFKDEFKDNFYMILFTTVDDQSFKYTTYREFIEKCIEKQKIVIDIRNFSDDNHVYEELITNYGDWKNIIDDSDSVSDSDFESSLDESSKSEYSYGTAVDDDISNSSDSYKTADPIGIIHDKKIYHSLDEILSDKSLLDKSFMTI